MSYSKRLAPLFDEHNIPKLDRPALVRYFNRPNGIPRKLRPYFFGREHKRFLRACLTAVTAQFLDEAFHERARTAG